MGTVCNKPGYHKEYPIIAKLMRFSPEKQFPLEKPLRHSSQVDEVYEINYLEIILNTQEEIPVIPTQEEKKVMLNSPERQTKSLLAVQEKPIQPPKVIQQEKNQDHSKSQRLNRSITQNSQHPDDCSVIMTNKNQANSDTQTLKSILKTNKSKSHKSAPKLTQQSSSKKVHFDPKVIKPRNRYLFM